MATMNVRDLITQLYQFDGNTPVVLVGGGFLVSVSLDKLENQVEVVGNETPE